MVTMGAVNAQFNEMRMLHLNLDFVGARLKQANNNEFLPLRWATL